VSGAHHLLTDGEHCALIGAYRQPGLVTAGRLDASGGFSGRRRLRLRLPRSGGKATVRDIVARGDTLHVFLGTTHHLLDLDQLMRG
jgi:hypothetical protein